MANRPRRSPAKRDEAGFLATPEFRLAPPLMPRGFRLRLPTTAGHVPRGASLFDLLFTLDCLQHVYMFFRIHQYDWSLDTRVGGIRRVCQETVFCVAYRRIMARHASTLLTTGEQGL